MTQQTSPWLEGKFGWNYGESGWNGGMDENLLKFSFLFDGNIDGIVSTLPLPATNGTAYFLTSDNRLYFAASGTYYSSPLPKWFIVKVKSSGENYQYDGSALTSVPNTSELSSRVLELENTSNSLGTAAFEDSTSFATPTYVDTSISELETSLSSTVDDEQGSGKIGYRGRTQFSRNQDRPHVFDKIPAGQHAAIIAGTSSYDAAGDINAMIVEAGTGGRLWFPQKGIINSGPITVDEFCIGFRGDNSSGDYYSSKLKAITQGVPFITVSQPQFSMSGLYIEGLSNTVEKGEDFAQDCILLTAPGSNNNLDAVFSQCAFVYFREIIEMRGRNVRAANCLFSNSRRVALIPNAGLSDVRGLELYDCRYHSMSKNGTTFACIHAEPAANFAEVKVIGGEADDCLGMFTGFSSNLTCWIDQVKARGQGYSLDSSAHTASLTRRVVSIKGVYQGEGTAAGAYGAFSNTGAMLADVELDVMGCTGSGIVINSPNTKISGCIADAGQAANNTYDALQLGASAATCLVGNLKITQDQFGVKTNKARYGINNTAVDVEFAGGVQILGAFATGAFNRDTTRFFTGPVNRPGRQSEVWGVAPPTGAFAQGSICHNTTPTRVKNISHWVVVVGGASPTWTAIGTGYGTTAERPTLTTADAGYAYKDTTTSTLVIWNGAAWV